MDAYNALRTVIEKQEEVTGQDLPAKVYMDHGRGDIYIEINGQYSVMVQGNGSVSVHRRVWEEVK